MTARLFGAVWGLALTAALVWSPLALRDRLPDPLATHWAERADGYASLTAYAVTTALAWTVIWVVLLAVHLHGRALERSAGRAVWWASLVGAGVLMVGISLTTLYANLDQVVWNAAELPGWLALAAVVAALGAGAAAGLLGKGAKDPVPPAGERPPALRLRKGQRAVWVSRAGSGAVLAASFLGALTVLGMAVLAYLGILPGAPWAVLVAVGTLGLLAGLFSSAVTVRVTEGGVALAFGPFGWPVRRIDLSKIEKAWSEERRPSEVGGWGFRGVPGAAVIMMRAGECLVLRYHTGGRLLVSVDDAASGAALVNALVERKAA
ncbi:hypothetical protein [Nonomuraea longicatena]|uniref:DUF1648 domain-containing protein n=1 Tax=Nonomuraea longicatena TaxID=83682 RepID=A0ABP4AB25_9ACTN